MLISGVVLLLAFAALFCFQAYTLRQQSAHELAVVGEITAHNCATAVMFKDEGAAAQILTGLKTMPQIVSARLEVTDQQRLAYFGGLRDELEIKAAGLNRASESTAIEFCSRSRSCSMGNEKERSTSSRICGR
jgi:hypothetical protein